MTSYHLNPTTGDPGKCRAQAGNCPFGSADEHYESKADARKAFEKAQTENAPKQELFAFDTGDGYYSVKEGTSLKDMYPHLQKYYQKAFHRIYGDPESTGKEIFAFNTGDGYWSVKGGDTIESVPSHLHEFYIKAWETYEAERLEAAKPQKRGFLSGFSRRG